MTRTRIKICGLTREQDVDAAVAAGADAVGFVLYYASARYVSAERAAKLAARLPPFVTPVLLFVNASATEIISACARIYWASGLFGILKLASRWCAVPPTSTGNCCLACK